MTVGKLVRCSSPSSLVIGRRVIPWLLHYVARTVARVVHAWRVLAIALGVAYGRRMLFGVSIALGAFLAGMVVGESESATRPPPTRCRCATRSPCCSSSRSACCSTP